MAGVMDIEIDYEGRKSISEGLESLLTSLFDGHCTISRFSNGWGPWPEAWWREMGIYYA